MAKSKKRYQPTDKKGAKHFSVTVPVDLLAKVNKKAKAEGISRSYLTTKALQAYVGYDPTTKKYFDNVDKRLK